MIKRLMLAVLVALPMMANAQLGSGVWKQHPVYGTTLSNVVDAGNAVYSLVSGSLFKYDKATSTNESVNMSSGLSGVSISAIYFNKDKNDLLVVYDDSNIDVIKADGSITNLPVIKNTILSYSKTVNDITFANGKAYIATNFGYLVLDDSNYKVKESNVYYKGINSVTPVGKWVFASLTSGDSIYYAPSSGKHGDFKAFKPIAHNVVKLFPINDSTFFTNSSTTGNLYLAVAKVGEVVNDTLQITETKIHNALVNTLQRTATGFVANFMAGRRYYILDANGANPTYKGMTNELYTSIETDGSWWALSASGLRHLVGTTYSQYYKPQGLTMAIPYWMTYDKTNDKLYVSNTGTNSFFTATNPSTSVNTLKNGVWKNVTPKGLDSRQGTYRIHLSPVEENTYYLDSWWSGVYKVRNDSVILKYNWLNSPMSHALNGYYCATTSDIDGNGNLWVLEIDHTDQGIVALPKNKLALDSVGVDDWATPNVPSVQSNKRSMFAACKVSNVKVFCKGDYNSPVLVWKEKDASNLNDVNYKNYNNFSDQDGKKVSWTFSYDMVEDLDGRVWYGFNDGLVYFYPNEALEDENFHVYRVKVPRNDGTTSTDVLLSGIQVNSIAVAPDNTKWIGTNTAGLYHVSADGTTILGQYSTTNSELISDQIYQVCCNENNNTVYITCSKGFMEFDPTATPAASDYSSVKAYPDPVTPDFTGMVTISNLMANSEVTIVDGKGTTVATTTSTGGVALWDVCNAAGQRVATGLYRVLAKQTGAEGEATEVTRIRVIK